MICSAVGATHSTQHLHQILGSQMRVPLQHLQCLMSRNGCDLHGVESLLEQPAGRLVAQVVEAKILEAGLIRLRSFMLILRSRPISRAFKRLADRLWRDAAPHTPVDVARKAFEDLHRFCGERHAPGFSILGFGYK